MARTKLTPEEQLTIASYDLVPERWSKAHANKNYWKEEVAVFKKYLPKGRIIEIGAGGGRDAQLLKEAGYNYFGTDISEGLLKVAKKNNPKLTFILQSVYDLNFPKDSFDGFWASAVLLHIPKLKIDKALINIHKIIRSGGVGFISVKQGHGESISDGDEDFGDDFKRLFALYSNEEFSQHLLKNRFEIVDSLVKPISKRTTWLIYYVRVIK